MSAEGGDAARQQMAEAYALAAANRDKLDGCPRHCFPDPIPAQGEGVIAMFGRKMVCSNCGGKVDLVAINYYVRGYEAAGGNGNDIVPGWRETLPEEPSLTMKRRYMKQDQE